MRKITVWAILSLLVVLMFSWSAVAECPVQDLPYTRFYHSDIYADPILVDQGSGYQSNKLTNVTNWKLNGAPIEIVNMPVEGWADSTEDLSGNNNDGIAYGINNINDIWVWDGGQDGFGAWHLDGVDDYIEIADSSTFDTDDLSISTWIKFDVVPKNKPGFVFKKDQFEFLMNEKNKLALTLEGTTFTSAKNRLWNKDQWYHIAVTFDDSADAVKFYVNGVLDNVVITTKTNRPLASAVIIGRNKDTGVYFDGYIDDLHIYNRSLTPEQISAYYTEFAAGRGVNRVLAEEETVQGETWTAQMYVGNDVCISSGAPAEFRMVIYPGVTACGRITSSALLKNDITTTGDCFIMGANSITLDGNGYTITGDKGQLDQGVYSVDYDDITITNFGGIRDFGILPVHLSRTENSEISHNALSINLSFYRGVMIYLSQPGVQNKIAHNLIEITNALAGSPAVSGIQLDNGAIDTLNNEVYGNTIKFTGKPSTEARGIILNYVNGTEIYDNVVKVRQLAGDPPAVYLVTDIQILGSRNRIHDNIFNSPSASPLVYFSNHHNNVLWNNEFLGNYELWDETETKKGIGTNYLIYNNSFGEIKWIDDSVGGFLRDLSINMENGLGLNTANIYLGDNVAAFDTSAIIAGNINSKTRITLRGLTYPSISSIYKISGYSTNPAYIQSTGTDCLGTTCTLVSYSDGTLVFDSNKLGSFSASEKP